MIIDSVFYWLAKRITKFALLLIFLVFSGCTYTSGSPYSDFDNDYIYFANFIQAINNEKASYTIKKFDDFPEYDNQVINGYSLYTTGAIDYLNQLASLISFDFTHYHYHSYRNSFSINGETPVYNILYWFKIERVWDASGKSYHFALDEENSFLKDKLVFELKNQSTNEQLQLKIPAIAINSTNESLSKNFIYREVHNLTFSMLTNYFKVKQDQCHFPEVNIFLPANAEGVVSLSITNDINKNGYYCYPNQTKALELRF